MAKLTFSTIALLLVGITFALSLNEVHSTQTHRSSGYLSRQVALLDVMNKIKSKAPIDELRKILNNIQKHIDDELAETRNKLTGLKKSCDAKSSAALSQIASVKQALESINSQVQALKTRLVTETSELTSTDADIGRDRNKVNQDEIEKSHITQDKEDTQISFEQKLTELKNFLEALYDIKAAIFSSVLMKRRGAKSPKIAKKLERGVERSAPDVKQPSAKELPAAPAEAVSADEKGLGNPHAELLEKDNEGSDLPAAKQIKALLLSLSERVAPEHKETLALATSLVEAGAPVDDLIGMIEKLIKNVEKDIKSLRVSHNQHLDNLSKQSKDLDRLIAAVLRDLAALKKRGNTLKVDIASITEKIVVLSEQYKARRVELKYLRRTYSNLQFDCSQQEEKLKADIGSLLEEQRVLAQLRKLIEEKVGSSSLYVKKRIGKVSLAYNFHVGAWSPCSVTCGRGTQNRNVQCVNFGGDKVKEARCAAFTRPRSTRTCIARECPQNCVMGKWRRLTECSTTCGAGTYTMIRDIVTPSFDGKPCEETTKTVSCNNEPCNTLLSDNFERSAQSTFRKTGRAFIAVDSNNPYNHVLKFSGCSTSVQDAIVKKFVHASSGKYRVSFDYRASSANLKSAADGLKVGFVDNEHNSIIVAARDRTIPSAVYHFGNVPEKNDNNEFVRVSFVFDAKNAPTGRFFPHKATAQAVDMSKTPISLFLSEHNESGAGCGQVEIDNLNVEELHD